MLSGRAIAILTTGAAGLVLVAASLLMPADKRFLAIASGIGTGAAGATAAACWRKPRSQAVTETVNRVQQAILNEAEQGIKGQLQPAPWTLNAIDIESSTVTNPVSEPLTNPEQVTYSPVSNPVSNSVSEVSDTLSDATNDHSLFNFDIDPNSWESTHSLSDEQEPARY